MTTSLGLDIGTNSIGWCLFEGDAIKGIGVRIYTDGRDPKSGASLAVDRRDARAMRRRRDRYIGRRAALLKALVGFGLMPDDKVAAKALQMEGPYALRAKALDHALAPYELGRALFHLNQRRGFKSNRKADRKSGAGEDGKIASGTKALDVAMREAGARTLGEFLHGKDTKRVRMRPEADGYDFYPDRQHYEEEFATIWAKQSGFRPELLTEQVRARLYRIIFFQRPLKEQEVGYCTFAGFVGVPEDSRRLPKAHPLFQQRRLYEEVNQLRIVTAGAADRPLTRDERDALILKLQDKPKVSFITLAKTIKLADGERFNKESENRKDLTGDEVRAIMQDKKGFGARWLHFGGEEQWAILERLIDMEDPQALFAWLKQDYGLDEAQAEVVANARLPEGYGRFGMEATEALIKELKADVITYAEAASRAGFHHSDHRTGEVFDQLPYYGEVLARDIAPGKEDYGDADEARFGKITNPTVHIGMNQLRRLVNAIIRTYGRPETIYVELARELKLNEKQKAEHNRKIKQNTDVAQARGQKLAELGERDSGGNRMRMRIWEELNPANPLDRRCPFCGEVISAQVLMNGSAEIEHIIPYSRCLDDGAANKVIAHTHCNRQKGNRTPWEQWGGTERWDIIQDQVARLHKSKQWRFGPDAMERVDRDGGFVARQLTDTQYLSRLAAKYLASLYPEKGERHVYAVTGRMTAMLRRLWGLNDILPDHNHVENVHSNAPKNRLDHRHHAIDAAVVGVTTPSMINRIAKAAARAEGQNLDKLFVDLPVPWEGFREELRERLLATTVSHKADHGRKGRPPKNRDVTSGRLHNDTAYGLTGRTNAKGAPIVVTRKPLLSLKPADLTDPERMTDHDLQSRLFSWSQHAKGDTEFKNALRKFRDAETPYKGINRVRLCEPLNVIPVHDKAGKAYKAYLGDSNALYTVWRMPDGKWVSSVISTFDIHQRGYVETRPHPAAKKMLSLRQNDLVALEKEPGILKYMRVQKFGQNGQIFFIEHHEAGNMPQRDKVDINPFKFWGPSASVLKKMKARHIRIDELGRIFDPGPRD